MLHLVNFSSVSGKFDERAGLARPPPPDTYSSTANNDTFSS